MGLEEAMCPREALLLVVKVVQVVFHVSTSNHSIFEKNHFKGSSGISSDRVCAVANKPC